MSDASRHLDDAHSPGSIPDTPAVELDDILYLQTKKAELVQERNILAQKRLGLKQSVERLQVSLAHYKTQQLQYETKQKLEYYLHQNDHESAKLSRPDEAASFILKNLNVLPTTDVGIRMNLIDKLYPCMSISQDSIMTAYEGERLLTVISFQISASGLPPLKIRLSIIDATVDQIELPDYHEIDRVFQKISQSFCKALIENYCRLKKIDLMVYSYHSLAQLQSQRIASLSQILRKHASLVTRPVSWESDPTTFLMSLKYIELTVTGQTKNETFKVRLQWDLVIQNIVSGEAESQLCFSVHKVNSGPLKNTNDVFLNLVLDHGITGAFSLMILNLFGV